MASKPRSKRQSVSLPPSEVSSSKSMVQRIRPSAFAEIGFKATIELLHEEIRELYLADDVPWIIGYSGGKDSTATLQLVWGAIRGLSIETRKKTVYVISTD